MCPYGSSRHLSIPSITLANQHQPASWSEGWDEWRDEEMRNEEMRKES